MNCALNTHIHTEFKLLYELAQVSFDPMTKRHCRVPVISTPGIVPGWSLGLETGTHALIFLWVFLVPSGKYWDNTL
jgi:hypothetical protein